MLVYPQYLLLRIEYQASIFWFCGMRIKKLEAIASSFCETALLLQNILQSYKDYCLTETKTL